jgi:hypothetical protein
MADFPAIEPASRSYDLGAFPLTEEPSFSAGPVRFRHATTPTDYRLNLEYAYLTDAQATEIRNHFQSQGGTYRSFMLPATIWKGHTFSGNVFPVGTRWRYADVIEETHHGIGRYSIAISLVSDGTYEDQVFASVNIGFAAGVAGGTKPLNIAVSVALAPGAASSLTTALGATFTCTATLVAGTATGA